MKNLLLFSDLHITQTSLQECKEILDEILSLCDTYQITQVINLGDTFDSLKPSSVELDLFASFIKELNRFLIVIAADSHESANHTDSILNHYSILTEKMSVVKSYEVEEKLFCGHLIVKEAQKNFGANISKEAFKKYFQVFLGHQHRYEVIKPNICQLGSVRFVNFDEAEDKRKVVAILQDFGTEEQKTLFVPLKSPIPMVQFELNKNTNKNDIPEGLLAQTKDYNVKENAFHAKSSTILTLRGELDKLNPKTKVKVKIGDFDLFRQFLPLANKYSSKFTIFKYETDFEIMAVNNQKCISTEMKTFKESFLKWLEAQTINTQIKDILLKEIE